MKTGIAEHLKACGAIRSQKGKVQYLREHRESNALPHFLRYVFDPRIEWLVPEGTPPYKAQASSADLQGMLYSEMRRFYLFTATDGSPDHPTLQDRKREMLFVSFLENLDPDDAKMIVAAKDGKLLNKSITPAVVLEAYPGLFVEKTDDKEDEKK